jgi:predicted kinase
MVGLPCSGKTTLALTFEREHSALRLTVDEWHLRLFGQDAEDSEHNARHSLIELFFGRWPAERLCWELT